MSRIYGISFTVFVDETPVDGQLFLLGKSDNFNGLVFKALGDINMDYQHSYALGGRINCVRFTDDRTKIKISDVTLRIVNLFYYKLNDFKKYIASVISESKVKTKNYKDINPDMSYFGRKLY